MNYTIAKLPKRVLNVAFDVSSETLNWSVEVGDTSFDGQCENTTDSILKTLLQLQRLAKQQGFGELRVICESTGIYHRSLLRIASNQGMRTNLVHGEAVSKYRAIQFADLGKTDVKDPRAMLTVAQVGKLIKHRQLDTHFEQLRELHRLVIRDERRQRALKCELHRDLRTLFPDARLSKSVLYGPTGQALVEAYSANPHQIVAAGREGFERGIKSLSPQTKRGTLQRIWQAAEASIAQRQDPSVAGIQAQGVREVYAEIRRIIARINALEARMQSIYDQLREVDRRLPAPQKHVASKRLLSRLVAEIGPPDDFRTLRQLLRYAGLNLCERQSGKWRGRTMISGRGRSEIRYVLNLMALPLIGRNKLFGEYYFKKKEVDRMPGTKAMTCVMRKILKMFFGWSRSQSQFDEARVFRAKSESCQVA